ncbi:hypothetical protein HKX48_008840 [Thoreauomyces humboldtii]|nr:hypothetical protein HKX48_008840 [Thoreauomyces humboldtii]
MFVKSIFAAFTLLASVASATDLLFTAPAAGAVYAAGGPIEIDWEDSPNGTTIPGTDDTAAVTFQVIDFRNGNTKGQLAGSVFATSTLNAKKVTGTVPAGIAAGTAYALAYISGSTTLYTTNLFTITAGTASASGAAAATSVVPVSTVSATVAATTQIAATVNGQAATATIVGSSAVPVATVVSSVGPAASGAAVTTPASKSDARSNVPAFAALAAIPMAAVFLA